MTKYRGRNSKEAYWYVFYFYNGFSEHFSAFKKGIFLSLKKYMHTMLDNFLIASYSITDVLSVKI